MLQHFLLYFFLALTLGRLELLLQLLKLLQLFHLGSKLLLLKLVKEPVEELEQRHVDRHQAEEKQPHQSEHVTVDDPDGVILKCEEVGIIDTAAVISVDDYLADYFAVYGQKEGHQADKKGDDYSNELTGQKSPLIVLDLRVFFLASADRVCRKSS